MLRQLRSSWLATYQDVLESPIQVLTGPVIKQLRWSRSVRYL